jgi:hypothetical protein
MNSHALEIKQRYVQVLGQSAREYLETGFDLFHRHRRSEASCGQAAFGNLAIALECALKCVLADKNFGAVFRKMPSEARIVLSAPERVPEFFQWRNISFDLSSEEFETIDFSECVSGYYVYAPHMKQLLLPHLSFTVKRAAAGLRTILPPLAPYEFARSGYAALLTVISLERDEAYAEHIAFVPGEAGRRFLDEFDAGRVERVSRALERARGAAPKHPAENTHYVRSGMGWNSLVLACPVCGSEWMLDGYSELSMDGEEMPKPGLDFFGISFFCAGCGLVLHDVEELKLAGMAMIYDRSGELDAWMEEHGGRGESGTV